MSEARYRKMLRDADKWQEEQLKRLAERSYQELSALPERTPLESPPQFRELQLIVYRGRGDYGGLMVAVQRVFPNPDGESRQGPWFEILPNGSICDSAGLPQKRKPSRESAPWMGTTGLGAALERELPRYLRRELGESQSDPKALTAADLTYVGSFLEGGAQVHYWRIPYGRKRVYAYIRKSAKEVLMGWGDRKPKKGGHAV